MTTQSETGNGRRISLYWGAAFVIGTFGTGTLARYFQLDGWLTMAVMIPPMLLLIPFLRSVERANIQAGNSSPAMQRYNRRALIFAFGYMAALFAAIGATDMFKPQGAVAWVLAILPSLPIAYMVYAMGRYLTEEDDEYLRMKAASAARRSFHIRPTSNSCCAHGARPPTATSPTCRLCTWPRSRSPACPKAGSTTSSAAATAGTRWTRTG